MKIIDILNLIVKTSVDFEYNKYGQEVYTKEQKYERYLNDFLESLQRTRSDWLEGVMAIRENTIELMTKKELQEELEVKYVIYFMIGHTGEYIICGYNSKEEAYNYYERIEDNTFTTEIMIIHEGKLLEYGGYIVNYKNP